MLKVKFVGHGTVLLTDFNGKRYAFAKGIPVEISQEIYNNMRDSGHIDIQDLVICEEKVKEEKPKETIISKTTETIKKAIKPKGKNKR